MPSWPDTILPPDWPAPSQVRAAATTRQGGVSLPPFDSFNLATHVGDDPTAVARNRAALREALALPAEPLWLEQVHGVAVARLENYDVVPPPPKADASICSSPGKVCAVLTADCLPVLFCNRAGTRVAAAHAGWRGLAGGVLEATVSAMDVPAHEILAWLGPAIGAAAFEVGEEVRRAFVAQHPAAEEAFQPSRPGHWLADIYRLAHIRLQAVGVEAVYGGGLCTYTDATRFYSYRRDGKTGRMASLVWLDDSPLL